MLHICLIFDDQLYQYRLPEGERRGIYTPLSTWESAQAADGELLLPRGWVRKAGYPAEYPADRIPLREEGNYLLAGQKHLALMMVRIVAEDGLRTERVRMMERFTVGRSRKNQLCCRDGYLSAFHGVFSFDRDGRLRYEDTSTNGAFLNGVRLRGSAEGLKSGDVLDFAPLMQVTLDGAGLLVRYPAEHAVLSLEKLSAPPPGQVYALVLLRETGHLRYIQLPEEGCTGAELRAAILGVLSPEEKTLLSPGVPLRLAGETALIVPDDTVRTREEIVVVMG